VSGSDRLSPSGPTAPPTSSGRSFLERRQVVASLAATSFATLRVVTNAAAGSLPPPVLRREFSTVQIGDGARSLLLHLSQPAAVAKLVAASGGYDLPAFENDRPEDVGEQGPRRGQSITTDPPQHQILFDLSHRLRAPKVAQQIYAQRH